MFVRPPACRIRRRPPLGVRLRSAGGRAGRGGANAAPTRGRPASRLRAGALRVLGIADRPGKPLEELSRRMPRAEVHGMHMLVEQDGRVRRRLRCVSCDDDSRHVVSLGDGEEAIRQPPLWTAVRSRGGGPGGQLRPPDRRRTSAHQLRRHRPTTPAGAGGTPAMPGGGWMGSAGRLSVGSNIAHQIYRDSRLRSRPRHELLSASLARSTVCRPRVACPLCPNRRQAPTHPIARAGWSRPPGASRRIGAPAAPAHSTGSLASWACAGRTPRRSA